VLKNRKSQNNVPSGLRFGPDTSGCAIDCKSNLIRERAYRIFEARGRQPGHDLDDWLQAEREINAQFI
jgi:hypothetical protein